MERSFDVANRPASDAGDLLENLTKGRRLDVVERIIMRVVTFAEREMRDQSVVRSVRDWLRGHFIKF